MRFMYTLLIQVNTGGGGTAAAAANNNNNNNNNKDYLRNTTLRRKKVQINGLKNLNKRYPPRHSDYPDTRKDKLSTTKISCLEQMVRNFITV